MSLTQQFDDMILDPPRPLLYEEEEEQEEEDDEDDEDEDEDEEEIGMCGLCLKEGQHYEYNCPYLELIENPREATIGANYSIVCVECGDYHSDHTAWHGRAIRKVCYICEGEMGKLRHWTSECPKRSSSPRVKPNNVIMLAQEWY